MAILSIVLELAASVFQIVIDAVVDIYVPVDYDVFLCFVLFFKDHSN